MERQIEVSADPDSGQLELQEIAVAVVSAIVVVIELVVARDASFESYQHQPSTVHPDTYELISPLRRILLPGTVPHSSQKHSSCLSYSLRPS